MLVMKGKKYEIITHIFHTSGVGGDFVDEKTYDPRGYVPRPNIELLLQRTKEFQKKS
jgi:hypothetical protein